jgi:Uncharacterized protein family, UPF0114
VFEGGAMVSELTKLNFRRATDRVMFATRWIAAPIYIGLFGALCIIAVKFADKLFAALPDIFAMTSNQAILTALTLIDLVLVANLVIMVMFAAWENCVADAAPRPCGPAERPARRRLQCGQAQGDRVGGGHRGHSAA